MKKQTAFRLDDELLAQLGAVARINNLSLNAQVNEILSNYVEALRGDQTFMKLVEELIKKDSEVLRSFLPSSIKD